MGEELHPHHDQEGEDRNTMIELMPEKLSFDAPGALQSKTVDLTCTHPTTIGYKVQTSKNQFYRVSPVNGILLPGEKIEVVIKRLDTLSIEKMAHHPPPHKFYVVTVEWPNVSGGFEAALFTRLEKCQVGCHTTILQVEHDLKGMALPPAKEPVDSPVAVSGHNLIEVEPTSLTIEPPYGMKKTQGITITNQTDCICAYKILGSKHQFYNVQPAKGTVSAHKSIPIQVELSETFNEEERGKYVKNSHKFQILAMRWHSEMGKQFKADEWTKLAKENRKDIQTLYLNVNLE